VKQLVRDGGRLMPHMSIDDKFPREHHRGRVRQDRAMSSPIEALLREALLRPRPAYWIVDGTAQPSALRSRWIEPSIWLDDDRHERAIYVYRSVDILTYRADFLLELGARRLIIECDGHDFHDRTKQQAAYDRSRDRELLQIGIPTVRFTGSEITHSPERCADDAYRCLLALPDERKAFHEGWEEATAFCVRHYDAQAGLEEHW